MYKEKDNVYLVEENIRLSFVGHYLKSDSHNDSKDAY
jgi:hypothetical protein